MIIRAQKDRKNVGFLELTSLKNGDLEIAYIWVSPDHRGNKFASKMLKQAITAAKKQNKNLVAYVEPHKDSSLNFEQEISWLTKYGFSLKSKYKFGERNLKPVMMYTPQNSVQ